jgi:hypothetical protein
MIQELQTPLVRSVGRKLAYETPTTMDEYLRMTSKDGVWVQGLYTIHHPTPHYTTLHHPTPPYTTIDHRTPPYTSNIMKLFIGPVKMQ